MASKSNFLQIFALFGIFAFTKIDGFPKQLTALAQEDIAVTNFQNYVQIDSSHPDPDYEPCIAWLNEQAEEIGLEFKLVSLTGKDKNLSAVLMSWTGSNPGLQSILINSHMDVVATGPDENWEQDDPFSGHIDAEGYIYGRGTVDMKSATVGTLEAIKRLKNSGFVPLRTIHVSIMPDEEVGGRNGMKPFVQSQAFTDLNVGFDLDECTPNPGDEIMVAYGEKSIWQFNFTARGKAGHASTLPETTAGQKLQIVIDRLMEFRKSQFELLNPPEVTMEDITSLNLVRLGGGIGNNIIPDELWASFDMRIRLKPNWQFEDVERMLNDIATEAGPDVTFTYIGQALEIGETDMTGIWWTLLQETCRELNVTCKPQFLSGATDGKYVRNAGIPVYGLNPFINTNRTGHEDNERINEREFLDGIIRYEAFIRRFSSTL